LAPMAVGFLMLAGGGPYWNTLSIRATSPTFWYQSAQKPTYWRAALELAGAQAVALVGYAIVDPPSTVAETPNPVPIADKLLLRPWGITWDSDDYGTNFGGHTTSGTIYYLIARGNRLTVLESFLFSAATSLVWELIEYHEPMSINDLLVTPYGGMAIGEPLTQLGAWFERAGPTVFNRAMAWILGAPKKVHDLTDGATVRRDPEAMGWHEFRFAAYGGIASQGGGRTDWGARLEMHTEIFRALGYGTEGVASRAMPDAVQSSIGLEMGFAGSDLADFHFATRFAAWGWYWKDLEAGAGEPVPLLGHDLFAGVTFGLDYRAHDWFRGRPARTDEVYALQLVGGTGQLRLFRGRFRLDARLDAALELCGVRPFPFSLGAVVPADIVLPNVTYAQDYYYGVGLMVEPSLEARLGDVAIGVSFRGDFFTAFHGRDLAPQPGVPATMQDRRLDGRAWARWRFPAQGVQVALLVNQLGRWGRVDEVSLWQVETDVWASVSAVF